MGWVEAATKVLDNSVILAFANLESVTNKDLDFFWEHSVGGIVLQKMNVGLDVA